MADNSTISGVVFADDDIGGVHYQRVKLSVGADGAATDASSTNPVPVREPGTFAYAAGTTTGTIDVPTTARLKTVSVLANATSATTVTIGGGATITIPAGGSLDDEIKGDAINADVVIAGGAPQSYYITWIT